MRSRASAEALIGQRFPLAWPARLASVTVSVEEPLSESGVTVAGLKLPVALGGNPDTLSATALVKLLPTSVTVIEYIADPPGSMVCDAGVAVTLKSGAGAFTTMVFCTCGAAV